MFKGVTIFQLTQPVNAVIEKLSKSIVDGGVTYKPPGEHIKQSCGFVPPLGPDTEEFTYEANGGVLFCIRTDEKNIPASALKEMVATKVRGLIDSGEDPSAVDERLIKEDLVRDLLPRQLAACSWTYAYIDKELSMLFVAGSEDASDAFVKTLSGALKATPFELLGIEDEPCDKFTSWLKDPELLGHPFELGDACTLKQAGEGGTTLFQIQHENLEGDDISTLISSGKQCCRVGLIHASAEFAITAKLCIRSIVLDKNTLVELGSDPSTADQFASIVVVIRRIMNSLSPILGGWPIQPMLDLRDELEDAAA